MTGTGNIGKRVAVLAKFLGMNVFGFDPYAGKVNSISHFISIHVPLTEETYHLINFESVEMMRKGVFILNTSRGKIVDERALIFGLKSGKISGCALDVFEVEPPGDSELFKFENCIFTPHIGGSSVESKKRISLELLRIIDDLLTCK